MDSSEREELLQTAKVYKTIAALSVLALVLVIIFSLGASWVSSVNHSYDHKNHSAYTVDSWNDNALARTNQLRKNKSLPPLERLSEDYQSDETYWLGCSILDYRKGDRGDLSCGVPYNIVFLEKYKVTSIDGKTPDFSQLDKALQSDDKTSRTITEQKGQVQFYLIGNGGKEWVIYIYLIPGT